MSNHRPVDDPGQAPGALVVQGLDPPALQSVMTAVADLRSCRELLGQIQARVMRNCWIIRNAFAERDDFCAFVTRELGEAVDANRAWDMAETWAIAKRNRPVAELAAARPREAVEFVQLFTRAIGNGHQTHVTAAVDEHEQEFNELVALPRAKRRKKLQQMAADRRAGREGRNPDDVARIEQLEGELDEAKTTIATAAAEMSRFRRCKAALEELRRCTNDVSKVVGEITELGLDGPYPKSIIGALTAQCDALSAQGVLLEEAIGQNNMAQQGDAP